MIDVDGSSDISFQEFRRFAILLPRSQASLSMALTLFLECLNGCRQASISKKCLCLFQKTQKGRSPVGALRQKNGIPADGVATACHQDLCFNQRCRHYALLVMLHLLSAIQQQQAEPKYSVCHMSMSQTVCHCASAHSLGIGIVMHTCRSRMRALCWTGWTARPGWMAWSTGWGRSPRGSLCSGCWPGALLALSLAQVYRFLELQATLDSHSCCTS